MQSSNRELSTVLLTSGGCLYRGEAHDVEHVNSAGPLQMQYRQMEPGGFRSSGVLLVLPNLVAGVGSVNRGTVARGTLLEKHICLHGSETPSLSCDFSQQTLGPGVLALIAPDCEVELYSREGRRGFSIALRPELWVRTADALGLGGVPVTGARLVPGDCDAVDAVARRAELDQRGDRGLSGLVRGAVHSQQRRAGPRAATHRDNWSRARA